MKKIILLLSLIMSILFVACSKSAENAKSQVAPAPTFTQEEVEFVKSEFSDLKIGDAPNKNQPNFLVKSIVFNSNEMYYEFEGTVTEDGKTFQASLKTEIIKNNNLYLVKITVTTPDEKETFVADFELSIKRLLSVYSSNDMFSSEQYQAFGNYINEHPSTVKGISIIYGHSYITETSNGVETQRTVALNIYINNGSTDIYNASIFKSNGKYIAADETGVVATENTLEAIFINKAVRDKIDNIIINAKPSTSLVTKRVGSNTTNIDISDFSLKSILKK